MTERQRYDTDLSDAEWDILKAYIPSPLAGGRPNVHERREIVNAIRYILRTAAAWHLLPHDFPPHKTVYDYFRQWRRHGVWETANAALREQVRQQMGRSGEPQRAMIDSQSVKTTEEGGPRGFDGGKRVKGRKRHLVVDSQGLLLVAVVHSAGIQDPAGARLVLPHLHACGFSSLDQIYADNIYKGSLVGWVKDQFGWTLDVITRDPAQKGFVVQKGRWVIERTFAWLGRYRRLSKDYEALAETSQALIYMAMTFLMTQRLALTH